MKFNLSYIYIFVFLLSCTQDMKIMKKPSEIEEPTYSSKGFALIYDNSVYENNIVDKKLKIICKSNLGKKRYSWYSTDKW